MSDVSLPAELVNSIRAQRAEYLLRQALDFYHANCMYAPQDYERPLFPLEEIEGFLGVTWDGGRRANGY